MEIRTYTIQYTLNFTVMRGKDVESTFVKTCDGLNMLGYIQGCASLYKTVTVSEVSDFEYNITCEGAK